MKLILNNISIIKEAQINLNILFYILYFNNDLTRKRFIKMKKSWFEFRQAFDYGEILTGERGRKLYGDRESSPLKNMKTRYKDASKRKDGKPFISFFTGHRGSGKSSMLFKLINELIGDFFVVYFDIEHNLDKSKTHLIDLLELIGASIFKTAKDEGLEPDDENYRELEKSLYSIIYEIKDEKDEKFDIVKMLKNVICFGAKMLGSELGENLSKSLLEPLSLNLSIKENILEKRTLDPKVQDIINNINLIIADVQEKAKKPILLVIDGLDKISPSLSMRINPQNPPELDQAGMIFLNSRALLGPKCNIIYTIPLFLYQDPLIDEIEAECKIFSLPNIKTYDPKNEKKLYEKGWEELQEIVRKRLNLLGYLSIEEIFYTDALDILIKKSGGILRWFIELIYSASLEADNMDIEKINLEAAMRAVDEKTRTITARLPLNLLKELQETRETKLPSGSLESKELLHARLIVAYGNGSTWFDAHPITWEAIKGTRK